MNEPQRPLPLRMDALQVQDAPTIIGLSANTVVKVLEAAVTAELQYQWGE